MRSGGHNDDGYVGVRMISGSKNYDYEVGISMRPGGNMDDDAFCVIMDATRYRGNNCDGHDGIRPGNDGMKMDDCVIVSDVLSCKNGIRMRYAVGFNEFLTEEDIINFKAIFYCMGEDYVVILRLWGVDERPK